MRSDWKQIELDTAADLHLRYCWILISLASERYTTDAAAVLKAEREAERAKKQQQIERAR